MALRAFRRRKVEQRVAQLDVHLPVAQVREIGRLAGAVYIDDDVSARHRPVAGFDPDLPIRTFALEREVMRQNTVDEPLSNIFP